MSKHAEFLDWLHCLDDTESFSRIVDLSFSKYLIDDEVSSTDAPADESLSYWVRRWTAQLVFVRAARRINSKLPLYCALREYTVLNRFLEKMKRRVTRKTRADAFYRNTAFRRLVSSWRMFLVARKKFRRMKVFVALLNKMLQSFNSIAVVRYFKTWKRRTKIPEALTLRSNNMIRWCWNRWRRKAAGFNKKVILEKTSEMEKMRASILRWSCCIGTLRRQKMSMQRSSKYHQVALWQSGFSAVMRLYRTCSSSNIFKADICFGMKLSTALKIGFSTWFKQSKAKRIRTERVNTILSVKSLSALQVALNSWIMFSSNQLQAKQSSLRGNRQFRSKWSRNILFLWKSKAVGRSNSRSKTSHEKLRWNRLQMTRCLAAWRSFCWTFAVHDDGTHSMLRCRSSSAQQTRRVNMHLQERWFVRFLKLQRFASASKSLAKCVKTRRDNKLMRLFLRTLLFQHRAAWGLRSVVVYHLQTVYLSRWLLWLERSTRSSVCYKRAELRFTVRAASSVLRNWFYFAVRRIAIRRCFRVFRHLHSVPCCSVVSKVFLVWRKEFLPQSKAQKAKTIDVRKRRYSRLKEKYFELWEVAAIRKNYLNRRYKELWQLWREKVSFRRSIWLSLKHRLQSTLSLVLATPVSSYLWTVSKENSLRDSLDDKELIRLDGVDSLGAHSYSRFLLFTVSTVGSGKCFALNCKKRAWFVRWKSFAVRSRNYRWLLRRNYEGSAKLCAAVARVSRTLRQSLLSRNLMRKCLNAWRSEILFLHKSIWTVVRLPTVRKVFSSWLAAYRQNVVSRFLQEIGQQNFDANRSFTGASTQQPLIERLKGSFEHSVLLEDEAEHARYLCGRQLIRCSSSQPPQPTAANESYAKRGQTTVGSVRSCLGFPDKFAAPPLFPDELVLSPSSQPFIPRKKSASEKKGGYKDPLRNQPVDSGSDVNRKVAGRQSYAKLFERKNLLRHNL